MKMMNMYISSWVKNLQEPEDGRGYGGSWVGVWEVDGV